MKADDNNILTVKELAEYLKLTDRSVYRLVQAGDIPACKIGGSYRFKKEVIDKWLDSITEWGNI